MITKLLKKLLTGYVGYFRFFYRNLGNAVFIAMFANLMVAVMDGIGLAMFLPLLQAVEGGNMAEASDNMGNMAFLLDAIRGVGIEITLLSILVVMFMFFCLKGLAKYASVFYQVILQQRFTNKLRLGGMKLLAGYKYSAFAQADSGRIQNSFSGEIGRVVSAYKFYFLTLQHGIMLLVYVGMAGLANPQFALMVAVGGFLSNFLFRTIYAITKKASHAATAENHVFQGLLIQAVASFKYLKATNLIELYKRKVEGSIISIEKLQRRMGKMSAIAQAIREPIVIGIVVVAIGVQVIYLEKSLGLIILSLLFLYRGLNSLVGIQNAYNNFLSLVGSIDNNEDFEKELATSQETVGKSPYRGIGDGLRITGLNYRYTDQNVLQGLDLTIPKNKTIGIVGGSGAGKTTLVNILCGLLKVQPGMLTIGGVDATELDLNAYRTKIGYVTQEAQTFSDTIYNNISFWAPLTEEVRTRIHRALRLAHAEEFVNELPLGGETVVGINGVNLSGGQRQRISIARELYRQVDVLILDEATSALDSQSEQLIQENIDSLSGQYTMLVIAHRLSTVRNADLILHLKPGGRYELGTFEELLERSDVFRKMVSLQMV